HDLLLAARLFVVFGPMAGHQASLSMDARTAYPAPAFLCGELEDCFRPIRVAHDRLLSGCPVQIHFVWRVVAYFFVGGVEPWLEQLSQLRGNNPKNWGCGQ
ncbi:MAG: hypothetical protein Q7T21_10315, partial [Gallionella sp.]|nr:hypothetical protein [Gallionella sp.]